MKRIVEILSVPKHLALFVVLASTLALSGAYISQYGFGLDPCALCFYQRKPYFVNIGLGLVAFLLTRKNIKYVSWILALCALTFFANSAIALFHVGVEKTWWKGLEACSNMAMPENATIEQMREFIKSRDIVRCDVPSFVFLGISMAGYNFLLSSFFGLTTAFFTLWNALHVKKN